MNEDVITVVGGGPVGLLLASLLGRQGIAVELWEKRRELPRTSMAIGITPPSLEILEAIDMREAFLSRGVRVHRAHVYEREKRCGTLEFDQANKQILCIPQRETMSLLRNSAAACSSVTLRIGETFSTERLSDTPGWVIACDGWKSPLCAYAGIRKPSKDYRVHFVMADAEECQELGSDAAVYFSPHGAVESFPLPAKRRRWIAQVATPDEADITFLEHRVKEATGIHPNKLDETSLCRFDPRWALAQTYMDERLVLCGDSAHEMSPIGGQGMNTGFADANKLAAVLTTGGCPTDLAHYERERKAAFRVSSARAAAGMWIGTRRGRIASSVRGLGLRTLLTLKPSQQWLRESFSMCNLPGREQI